MVKTILITLDGDIPDGEVGEEAGVSIGTNMYTGTVVGIVVHEEVVPTTTTVTLKGPGLHVEQPP